MSISSDVAGVERRVRLIAGAGQDLAVDRPRTFPAPAIARQAAGAFGGHVTLALERLVRSAATSAGIDPDLLAAVAQTESGFNPAATSPAGAAGLMQLMPATAQALGVNDPYDPAQNVRGGAAFLRQLLERFGGDVPRAVAAYNAGPGAVLRYDGIPPYPETRAYVGRVLAAYRTQSLR